MSRCFDGLAEFGSDGDEGESAAIFDACEIEVHVNLAENRIREDSKAP